MKILFVASEAAPYVKTGGLGDVIGALPRALAKRGHDLLVVVPRYGAIDGQQFGLRDTGRRVEVQFPNLNAGAHIHVHAPAERLRYLFLQNPWYDRRELYGEGGKDYRDNHKRFALLSAGALEAARQWNFIPDAIHAHDWQAALVPLIVKRGWAGRPSPIRARTVFTIHNVAYQGVFPREAMGELDLPGDLFNSDALEFYGKVNLIKAGLVFADKLATVSPTYAREIVESSETGAGLEGLLRHRKADLTGIMNGVDYDRWSPERDAFIPHRYSAEDLSGKAECKAELQQELGLDPQPGTMLCAAIGRLAHQKGYDMLAQAVPGMMSRGAQLALLGTGDAPLEEVFAAHAVALRALRPEPALLAALWDAPAGPRGGRPGGQHQRGPARMGVPLRAGDAGGPPGGAGSRAGALAGQGGVALGPAARHGPRPLLGPRRRPVRGPLPRLIRGLHCAARGATLLLRLRSILNFIPRPA